MAPLPYPGAEVVLGSPKSSWTYDATTGYDLSRKPSAPHKPIPRFWMRTSTDPITLDPGKTALIIVDMQNYFLSYALGHHLGPLHAAEKNLRTLAVPAARKAGIQTVHLTWGFSAAEAKAAPPAILRRFSPFFEELGGRMAGGCRRSTYSSKSTHHPVTPAVHSTLGDELGPVTLWNDQIVLAGSKLIRGTWNADLYEPMRRVYVESADTAVPDARFHKTRASGFFSDSGGVPEIVKFLRGRGITTLLIGGVRAEEGVWASARDAANWGFDVVLLRDGCGTLKGEHVSKTVGDVCESDLGFLSTCLEFSKGVESLMKGKAA